MNSAKPKPKITTKDRQDRDKVEYERLVQVVKQSLEHRSPGLWGWLDDTIKAGQDAVNEAIEWGNNLVDTYIWDTTEAEADVEGWVNDTFVKPFEDVKASIDEGVAWGNDLVDTYVWDTGGGIATLEGWVRDTFDIPDQETQTFVNEVAEAIADDWNDLVTEAQAATNNVTTTVTDAVTTTVDTVGDIIDKASIALGVGFDAAMAAIGILPTLFTGWKNELAAWFDIDIDKFLTELSDAQVKIHSKGI